MGRTAPRILFLSHSASRNGATILLLHLLRWLKTEVDWEIEVLVNGRGPLVDEFRSICKTTVLRNPAAFMAMFPRKLRPKLQLYLQALQLRILLLGRHFDLIYANTSATWPQVNLLVERSPVLLWHIHELGYALRLSIGEDKINQAFQFATRLIVVSKSVRETLVREFNVSDEKLDTVHGFIPFPNLSSAEQRSRRRMVINKLDWPENAFVVGGCGSLGWRKGTDLFLQIAHALHRVKGYENVRFLWVGGDEHDQEWLEFTHEVHALGLHETCCQISCTDNVSDFYCAMDVFALTSREDPFPLVMLEAGAHGIPVICFADSGGGPEFVAEDSGLVAPYLDIKTFVNHIMTLYRDQELRQRLGVAALRKVQTHHGIEVQGPKILQSIERCLETTKEKAL